MQQYNVFLIKKTEGKKKTRVAEEEGLVFFHARTVFKNALPVVLYLGLHIVCMCVCIYIYNIYHTFYIYIERTVIICCILTTSVFGHTWGTIIVIINKNLAIYGVQR